jgi:hypothetical protein
LLDHPLEFCEPLKGNAEGKLDAPLFQSRNNLITEKGAIHSHLDLDRWQDGLDGIETGQDKGFSPIRVVDVPGTVEEIKHLQRLSYGAEERVIASGPLFLFVESYS